MLAAARDAAAGREALGSEVLDAEARWLLAAAAGDAELAAAHAAAAAARRRLRERSRRRAPAGDVEVVFELAYLLAEQRVARDTEAAAAFAAELTARANAVVDLDRVAQEADERWAASGGAEAGVPLWLAMEQQRTIGELLGDLARRTGDRRLRRRSRRSLRLAADRQLQQRLERWLGRRGVLAVERTSFVLLIVVVAILAIESVVALSPTQATVLHWIDGLSCAFFVVEFGAKVVLAPHRWSWFWRNVWTDLLPALPSVAWLLPGPWHLGGADELVLLRLLRLRVFRLVLLLVRGMDGLVRRFRGLLDRDIVFLAEPQRGSIVGEDRRDLVFAALQRERTLFAALPAEQRRTTLAALLRELPARCDALPGAWSVDGPSSTGRELAVESACELLWTMRPGDVERYLRPSDRRALDRVVRVLSTPPLCWLPIVRRFCVRPLPATAEERIVAAGRRVADWLIGWQDRLLFFGDLHGIVTGPQILDRVASAMVKASQRPAVRLLLFGGLFLLFDLLIKSQGISQWLQRIVVGPLLILGSVCLVFLMLGWWLKRVAGEASESFRLTAEAHFVSLLGLQKRRHERIDLEFLGRRVLADITPGDPAELLRLQLVGARAGVPLDVDGFDEREERHGSRVALLYLHYLDGALLHHSDVKTTEQLLANLSLENLRHGHLGYGKKERKRLRQLRLDDGSVLRGPFLWFRFITESIAVEASKRIAEYNRRCVPLARRPQLSTEQEAGLRQWLQRRCDPKAGRTLERLPPPDSGSIYATTEFHALHFLAVESERDEHVRTLFGDDVLAALRADRRNMVREIFGTRPAHELDGSVRAMNVWRVYWSQLSHGRVLFLPLLFAVRSLRAIGWFVGRIRQIVREVVAPHLAMQRREAGTATFAVALRKIHRMKAPGLLEAIRLRVLVDPEYCGAPSGWSGSRRPAGRVPQLERDLDFLLLHERERSVFRRQAERQRELVASLQAARHWLPAFGDPDLEPVARADGELAVTVAWLTDRDDVRTLLAAETWRTDDLPALLDRRVRVALPLRLWWWCTDRCAVHPTDRWRSTLRLACPRRGRRNLRRAYTVDTRVRTIVDAWNRLPAGVGPAQVAIERLRAIYRAGGEVRRDLLALRTIQSLSVLDVRNYRDVVFELGGYAEDGEDQALARELP